MTSKRRYELSGEKKKLTRVEWAQAIAVWVVIALLARWFFFGEEGPSDEELYCQNTSVAAEHAYAAAMVHVKRQLRDPKSAEMPYEALDATWLGNCSFRIMGSVKAKNGFGGFSQSFYWVTVRYDAASDLIRFSDFQMD